MIALCGSTGDGSQTPPPGSRAFLAFRIFPDTGTIEFVGPTIDTQIGAPTGPAIIASVSCRKIKPGPRSRVPTATLSVLYRTCDGRLGVPEVRTDTRLRADVTSPNLAVGA